MNKDMFDRHMRLRQVALVMVLLTSFAGTLLAQTADNTQGVSSAPDNTLQDASSEGEQQSPARSLFFVPGFLENMRHSVGFSLGIYGSYDPSAILSSSGEKTEALKSAWVNPRLFANFRKKRSQTIFDYNFDARAYSGLGQLNGSSHMASLQFQRQMSRNVSLVLGEALTSASNDRRTFLNPLVFGANVQTPAQDFDVLPQRVTRNSLSVSVRSQVSRRNTMNVFGGYDFWRYTDRDLGNSHGVLVGVQSSLRINRWLALDNSYSTYLNAVHDPQSGGTGQIHRLQVGGLRFARSLGGRSHGWEASLTGGVDMNSGASSDGGRPQVSRQLAAPSVQGGISRNWESSEFSLVYRRGFWIAIGPGTAVDGDSVSASFNQSLRRANLTVGANYRRGSGSRDSAVDFVSGSAQLGFAVQRHLLVSADYWYVSQRGANLSVNFQNASRYRVGIGINYYLPSLFNR